MGKFLRLVFNRLGVVFLICVVFLSATQQVLSSTRQTIPLAYPEALPAIYPKLNFSTYFGGSDSEHGYGIAVTSDGSCYVTGDTFSSNFPTKNAYDSTYNDHYDAFISKFNASGSLLWSTYLGGSEGFEHWPSLAVTEDGSCFVTGYTSSDDFPTQNAYDNTLGGHSDAFITKFDDTPIPAYQLSTVTRFLIFIAVMPVIAFMPVIALIVYKKRK